MMVAGIHSGVMLMVLVLAFILTASVIDAIDPAVEHVVLPIIDDEVDNATTNDQDSCSNLRQACDAWAAEGRCDTDPRYMLPHCPKSCGACTAQHPQPLPKRTKTIKTLTPYAIEDAIGQDLGVPQITGSYPAQVRELVESARVYFEEVVLEEKRYAKVRSSCRNRHHYCAIWAAQGECEDNQDYMEKYCAPVCKSCHVLHEDARCMVDENVKNIWTPGDRDRMFERIVQDNRYNVTVLLSPADTPEDVVGVQRYPWVLVIDDFLTPDEAERLIQLGADSGYTRSADVGPQLDDGSHTDEVSDYRTSFNAWCSNERCTSDPVVKSVTERMTNLTGIPTANSEALQMLRYLPGQYYKSHHDYIEYQRERTTGVRILTVFLYLNNVVEGGGTNFPELDVTVMPKTGRALLWPSVLNDRPSQRDDWTMHQALPVIQGIKYGANAWLHQREFDAECA